MDRGQLRDSFRQFARNFKWGTCADCPRTGFDNAYPEFCRHTERYDHGLGIQALVERYLADSGHKPDASYATLVADRDRLFHENIDLRMRLDFLHINEKGLKTLADAERVVKAWGGVPPDRWIETCIELLKAMKEHAGVAN